MAKSGMPTGSQQAEDVVKSNTIHAAATFILSLIESEKNKAVLIARQDLEKSAAVHPDHNTPTVDSTGLGTGPNAELMAAKLELEQLAGVLTRLGISYTNHGNIKSLSFHDEWGAMFRELKKEDSSVPHAFSSGEGAAATATDTAVYAPMNVDLVQVLGTLRKQLESHEAELEKWKEAYRGAVEEKDVLKRAMEGEVMRLVGQMTALQGEIAALKSSSPRSPAIHEEGSAIENALTSNENIATAAKSLRVAPETRPAQSCADLSRS